MAKSFEHFVHQRFGFFIATSVAHLRYICNSVSSKIMDKLFAKAQIDTYWSIGYMSCSGCTITDIDNIQKYRFGRLYNSYFIQPNEMNYSGNAIIPFAAFSKDAIKAIPESESDRNQ